MLQIEKTQALGTAKNYKGYDRPIRICLKLGKYTPLPVPFVYGIDANASKGVAMTREEFRNYCTTKQVRA